MCISKKNMTLCTHSTKQVAGVGEMAQQLRRSATFTEDLGDFPVLTSGGSRPLVTSAPEGSDTEDSHIHGHQHSLACIPQHTHITKNNLLK